MRIFQLAALLTFAASGFADLSKHYDEPAFSTLLGNHHHITFDSDGEGNPLSAGTLIDDEYESIGLLVSPHATSSPQVNDDSWPGGRRVFQSFNNPACCGGFRAVFTEPVIAFGFNVGDIETMLSDGNPVQPTTLDVYGAGNTLLGSFELQQELGQLPGDFAFFGIHAGARVIHEIVVTVGFPDYVAFDDFRFTTGVSETSERIVFGKQTGANWDIWSINPDGSNLRQWTDTQDRQEIYPEISPHGTRLVYCDLATTPFSVNVLDLTTGQSDLIADGCDPSWSPDGSEIVYSTRVGSGSTIRKISSEVPSIPNSFTQLTFDGFHDAFPDWHPSGDRILFSRGAASWVIELAPVPATEVVPLLSRPGPLRDTESRYSSDGTRIAWQHNPNDTDNSVVLIGDASGAMPWEQVTQLPAERNEDGRPGWSPDDSRLVFHSSSGANAAIKIVELDTLNVQELTPIEETNSYASWGCIDDSAVLETYGGGSGTSDCGVLPPIAVCADQVAETDEGKCTSAFASVDAGSFDPLGGSLTLSQDPDGPYPLGDTPITLTAVTVRGTSATCTADVSVVDNEMPTITCPPTQVLECAGPDGTVASVESESTDNCGIAANSCDPTLTELFPEGTSTVACLTTDQSGNTSSCNAQIVVEDTIPPVVNATFNRVRNIDDDDGDDGGVLRVKYSASDLCDENVAIRAALVAAGCGEIAVGHRQRIRFERDNDCEVDSDDGVLEIEAPRLTLVVTATDASGNTAEAVVEAPGKGKKKRKKHRKKDDD